MFAVRGVWGEVEKGVGEKAVPVLTSLVLLLVFLPLILPAAPPGLQHEVMKTFTPGAKIVFSALAGAERVNLYFRVSGRDLFQARPMSSINSGAFSFELDSSILAGDSFEYYLEAEGQDGKTVLPADGPALVRADLASDLPEIPGDLPTPRSEESRLRFSPHGSASLLKQVHPEGENPDLREPGLAANLQIGLHLPRVENWDFKIDGNLVLNNNPPEEEPTLNLAGLALSLSYARHLLRMGDLNLNTSDYTVFGLGRRGIEYRFESPDFQFHAFSMNTQQQRGFRGFGLPAAGLNLVGALAGCSLLNQSLDFRAILVSGRDDPSRAVNLVTPFPVPGRRGTVAALVHEGRLFGGRLTLKAELARSVYDPDLNDKNDAQPDSAWNIAAGLNLGPAAAGFSWRRVGPDFNSIGLAYLANDRSILEGNLMISLGKINLQGLLNRQGDNVRADPLMSTTTMENGQINLVLSLSNQASLTVGWRGNRQETCIDEQPAALQDTAGREFSASLNLSLSGTASLSLSLTHSALASVVAPDQDRDGWTLSLGGFLRVGEWLNLAPNLGLSNSRAILADELDTSLNFFLSAELFFVPRVFSLALATSYNRMAMSVISVTNAYDLSGALNFHLGHLVNLGSLVFSVRAQYRNYSVSGMSSSETRVSAQLDLAF